MNKEEFIATLPTYRAKRSVDFPSFLIVWCPRADCPGTTGERPFLVAEREWMRPNRIKNETHDTTFIVVGRSCPYCFRTARIPSRRTLRAGAD